MMVNGNSQGLVEIDNRNRCHSGVAHLRTSFVASSQRQASFIMATSSIFFAIATFIQLADSSALATIPDFLSSLCKGYVRN